MSTGRHKYAPPGGHFYIVKGRGRSQHTVETKRGPRRVWRWDSWKSYDHRDTQEQAVAALEQRKKQHGLTEFAVFYRGKRLPHDRRERHYSALKEKETDQ